MPSVVCLGASVSLAPDEEPERYGTTLIRVYDSTGREVRSEVRGRELEVFDIVLFVELEGGERVSSTRGENRLLAQRDGTVDELRERVADMAYEDGERWPEWEPLMAAARARGADVGDATVAALPFAIEFSDDVLALHGSRDRSGQ